MWGFIQLLDINAHTRYIGWCSSLNRCRCLRGLPLLLLTKPEQTKLILVCRVVRLCPRQPLDPLDNSSVQTRLMGPPGREWVLVGLLDHRCLMKSPSLLLDHVSTINVSIWMTTCKWMRKGACDAHARWGLTFIKCKGYSKYKTLLLIDLPLTT